uniref:Protein NDRG2 n=1 Tax=Esox lucius TaxID=8010 RepID=A0A6Q2XXQ2_ESOLU
MTTEMQKIAITEEKPLLPGQTDPEKDAEIAARILLNQSQEHSIKTPHGVLHVTLYGTTNTGRPVILTVHDVGLDSKSCFSPLFEFDEMQEIVKNFTRVHIDAPGQEEGASAYPMGYQYPSMDQIAEMIPAVLTYFELILSVFPSQMANPTSVDGLVLINFEPKAKGWMEWTIKMVTSLTTFITEQILNHLFSQEEMSANGDLVKSHRQRISKAPNFINTELFWKSYNRCPVMLVVGDKSPHEEAAVKCNSKLNPTTTSFVKMADAGGLPQLTQPSKLTEAFKYFVQGMGYMPTSIMTRLARSRTTSRSSTGSLEGERWRSRTLSQTSQGEQMPPSPANDMNVSC